MFQQFLKFQGARSFDPYNVGMLQYLPESTCTVFVHEADLKHLHFVPYLLHLKHDLRVTFACYKDITDVKFRNYVPLFPSAGLVVIDDAALLACKSGRIFCYYYLGILSAMIVCISSS